MLIGVDRRFVFVANSKNASTSIEAVLGDYAEIQRNGSPRRKHVSAKEIRRHYAFLFDQEGYEFGTFFKFVVMRDPLDWISSWHRYRVGQKGKRSLPNDMDFRSFWEHNDWNFTRQDGSKRLQSDIMCGPNGRLLVDYIIPHHQLAEHFDLICNGLGCAANLGQKNVSRVAKTEQTIPDDLVEEVRAFYQSDYELFDKIDEINETGLAQLEQTRNFAKKNMKRKEMA